MHKDAVARRHLCYLESWLKVNYPMDVIMPAGCGKKNPKYTHLGGTWTWAQYDRYLRDHVDTRHDVGILMHQLCVVDADTPAAAAALEAAHPVLRSVPMERTLHGFHYYLGRSPLADLHGYYDCRSTTVGGDPAKRLAKVDFKTRCSGGTSGYVIVAPSTDKSWVRSPWDTFPHGDLPLITAELLDAVSFPHHVPMTVRLTFGDRTESCSSTWLARMAFVSLFVNDDTAPLQPGDLAVVPLPAWITHRQFCDMLRMLEGGDPQTAAGFEAAVHSGCGDREIQAILHERAVEDVVRIADFMGVPAFSIERIRRAGAGGSRNRADMMRVDLRWAADTMSAVTSDAMVPVDADLSDTLLYTPFLIAKTDDRWLMHTSSRCSLRVGQRVVAADPAYAATRRLPRFVMDVLRAESGHLALAGGAALAAVLAVPSQCVPSDFDLYIYDLSGTPGEKAAAADAIVSRVAAVVTSAMVTGHALTLSVTADEEDDDSLGHTYVVQIVLRIATDLRNIVAGFDLAPAMVVVTCDEFGGTRVAASPHWVVAMRHMAVCIDGRAWSRASALRVFKYVTKGFDAIVPGLRDRRLLVRDRGFQQQSPHFAGYDGFRLLFAIEAALSRGNRSTASAAAAARRDEPQERLSPDVIPRLARDMLLEQRSDYATALKTMRVIAHVLYKAGMNMLLRVGFMTTSRCSRSTVLPLAWRQPWSSSQFHPCHTDLSEVLAERVP